MTKSKRLHLVVDATTYMVIKEKLGQLDAIDYNGSREELKLDRILLIRGTPLDPKLHRARWEADSKRALLNCRLELSMLQTISTAEKYEGLRPALLNMKTETLQDLWDSYEEWSATDPACFILNTIHAVMNERGCGRYVAV